MAVLVLIKKENARDGVCVEGNVVGVFDDEHKFSEGEVNGFNFLSVKGTKVEVENQLQGLDAAKLKAGDTKLGDITADKYIIPKYRWTVVDAKETEAPRVCASKIVVRSETVVEL